MTEFITEETQVIVYATLPLFLSEPAVLLKLGCEGRGRVWGTGWGSRGGSVPGGTRVGQILVTGVWVSRSGDLAFITGLVRGLLTGVSWAISLQCFQYWASID